MEIKEQLLENSSSQFMARTIEVVLSDGSRFGELMECFFCTDYRLAQRAAAVVQLATLKNAKFIEPYTKDLVDKLTQKNASNAVLRNIVRILQLVEIPKEFHGPVIDSCFNFLQDPATPVAIKAFSLTILHNLSKLYQPIERELKLVIEDRFEFETAAFQSRARKILKALHSV